MEERERKKKVHELCFLSNNNIIHLLFSSPLSLQATSGDTTHLRASLPSSNKTIGNILLFIKGTTMTVLHD